MTDFPLPIGINYREEFLDDPASFAYLGRAIFGRKSRGGVMKYVAVRAVSRKIAEQRLRFFVWRFLGAA